MNDAMPHSGGPATAPPDSAADAEEIKAVLRKEFPEWSIIRTRPYGRWWALRRPEHDPTRRISNRVSDLDADTAEELRTKLTSVAQR